MTQGTTPPRIISNSEIRAFKRCRRKWWFGYFRGLRPVRREAVSPRAFGTAIHETLGAYYDPENSEVTDHESAMLSWDADQQRNSEIADDNGTRTEFDNQWGLGRIMLDGYFEWLEESGADAGFEVVDAEKEVFAPLPDLSRPVLLAAKYDLRVKDLNTGARRFVDHKTVENLTDIPKMADIDEQFMTYSMIDVIANGEGSFTDGGIFNLLRKVKRTARSKPPYYGREEVRFNIGTLRNFWYRLYGTVTDILRVEDALHSGDARTHLSVAYPNPTRDCSWDCDFRALCPLVDDPASDAEAMARTEFETGDPYERYTTRDDDE